MEKHGENKNGSENSFVRKKLKKLFEINPDEEMIEAEEEVKSENEELDFKQFEMKDDEDIKR